MGLYQDDGFVNWDYIINRGYTWNFVIGGRGTGKTYGILKKAIQDRVTTMFMRLTQTQIDLVASDALSPLKPLNEDMGWDYGFETAAKNVYTLCRREYNDKGKHVVVEDKLGYATALSTVKNIRGFGGEDVEWLIIDEFIPERHEKEISDVGNAVYNAYETINRNRELKGRDPLKIIFLANSNNIASEIIIEMGLLSIITKMEKNGQTEYFDKSKSIAVYKLDDSPISAKKKGTALYRVASQNYQNMALGNQFSHSYASDVASRNLKEYKPISAIGELTIYKHKSKEMLYVTTHRSGNPRLYVMNDMGLKAFRRDHAWMQLFELQHCIEYETELCHIIFTKLAFK